MNRSLGFGHSVALGLLGSLLCAASACDGCSKKKPYTPFGVASALPSVEPLASSAAAELPATAAPNGFAARKAELVPTPTETWQGSGLSLNAPATFRFAEVLPADFDQDQQLDALAWLVPAPGATLAPAELWYFPAGAAARKITELPGFVPSSADCTLNANLTQTGPRSATLDLAATCNTPLLSRSAARAFLVISPTVEHPVLLRLRAASAAPGETLTFSVDSSDQDHDGRDDVRLTVSVAVPGNTEPESADLVWLDRAAGASRSASEPSASLLRLAGKIGSQARTKRGAKATPRIASLRRLLSSLCAEGGVSRVFDEDGGALRCGDLSRVVDALGLGEVQALLAAGDTLGAFSVLSRDGWYFGKLSSNQKKQVERELRGSVSPLDLGPPLLVQAEPAVPEVPHYSPLAFESDGALLVHGSHGVTRLTADRSAEQAVSTDGGAPSSSLELALPNGRRVLGAVHACDRSELIINESDPQHSLLPPLVSSLLAARPASCTGRGPGPRVTIMPLAFDERGLEALIGGARVRLPPGEPATPGLSAMGTARSPDGRWLVSPSALGLLLIGDRKELWQPDKLSEHADAARFTDCVVDNEARAVACLDSRRAILFERPKPSPNATRK